MCMHEGSRKSGLRLKLCIVAAGLASSLMSALPECEGAGCEVLATVQRTKVRAAQTTALLQHQGVVGHGIPGDEGDEFSSATPENTRPSTRSNASEAKFIEEGPGRAVNVAEAAHRAYQGSLPSNVSGGADSAKAWSSIIASGLGFASYSRRVSLLMHTAEAHVRDIPLPSSCAVVICFLVLPLMLISCVAALVELCATSSMDGVLEGARTDADRTEVLADMLRRGRLGIPAQTFTEDERIATFNTLRKSSVDASALSQYLCPNLVVPAGRECNLVMPGKPDAADFCITDIAGVVVLNVTGMPRFAVDGVRHAPQARQEEPSTQPLVERRGTKQPIFYLRSCDGAALAMCRAPDAGSRSGGTVDQLQLLRPSGEYFGTVSKNSSDDCYILSSDSGANVKIWGTFEKRAVIMTESPNRLVATTAKNNGPVSHVDKDFYSVRVAEHTDVGVVVCSLLCVDLLHNF